MNSIGLSRMARSRPRSVVIRPEVASPPSLPVFHAGRLCLEASSSTTWKPILWRLRAYFAPGLPRPTTSHIGDPVGYFLAGLASLAGAALASLAGAAAAPLAAGAAAAPLAS